jgi:hypothetical protein
VSSSEFVTQKSERQDHVFAVVCHSGASGSVPSDIIWNSGQRMWLWRSLVSEYLRFSLANYYSTTVPYSSISSPLCCTIALTRQHITIPSVFRFEALSMLPHGSQLLYTTQLFIELLSYVCAVFHAVDWFGVKCVATKFVEFLFIEFHAGIIFKVT